MNIVKVRFLHDCQLHGSRRLSFAKGDELCLGQSYLVAEQQQLDYYPFPGGDIPRSVVEVVAIIEDKEP